MTSVGGGGGCTPGALGVHQTKKFHKSKSHWCLISGGVAFTNIVEIPKFWSPHRPALPSSPVFSGRGPKIKNQLPTFCSPCCPVSEKIWHNPLAQKKPGVDRFGRNPLFGVLAWPRGPRGPNCLSKNYLQGVRLTLKIWPLSDHWVKSYFTL